MNTSKRISLSMVFLIGFVAWSIQGQLHGCATAQKQREKIARDWCLNITASQVIPLYPLTEDVQPGDLFLVEAPLEEQRKSYGKKGFLPLDQLLHRLHPDEETYKAFYGGRRGFLPFPPQKGARSKGLEEINWKDAPKASFPSFTYEVSNKVDTGLAIPTRGVSLAMSTMNSSKAKATVSLSSAHTYGLDISSLYPLVLKWAEENKHLLIQHTPRTVIGRCFKRDYRAYLRVVSRVYAIDSIFVSVYSESDSKYNLNNEESNKKESSWAQSAEAISKVTKLISDISALDPKVKITSMSKNTTSLSEGFEKPIVVGYIGFDVPILKGGTLGFPISTLHQISESKDSNMINLEKYPDISFRLLGSLYEKLSDGSETKEEMDSLAKELLPKLLPVTVYKMDKDSKIVPLENNIKGAQVSRVSFYDVQEYLGKMEYNMNLLEGKSEYSKDYKASIKEFDRVMKELRNSHQIVALIQHGLY